MSRKFGSVLAFALFAFCAVPGGAQTPAPAPVPTVGASPQPGISADHRDQTKASTEGGRAQENFRTMRNLGRTPSFPHRIKEEGIKLPKCARESRDGEACK